MTQSPNPGQPYIPPSAGSAAGSYNPQQYPQQAQQPPQYQPAQAAQPGQAAPGQFQQAAYAGGQYAQGSAPKADSFMTNLFDGARDFASKYGKTIFTVGLVLYLVAWVFGAFDATYYHSSYDGSVYFSFGDFLLNLFVDIPKVVVNVLILRLIIEIAAKVGAPKADASA
ncbi:hypothetical protein SAMN05216355_102164 [Actinomyces ruminicola]|uniref:Uncharacterized protein n=1 Tax=Actinomyces ruminicola TaxID=332524 RepID=A0A1H0AVT3_9ACTO|nr:hypothetical protein [Actinomyces ruminicola]SDN37475.1 hypothetical protein SAMN05216355_102164 [Actinomyces ruminicola]